MYQVDTLLVTKYSLYFVLLDCLSWEEELSYMRGGGAQYSL